MLRDLPEQWRQRAAELRGWAAAEGAACALERAAAELEAALREQAEELLTLQEAAAESGYSARRLRELVAAGQLENVGGKGRPRFRRGDLPRKARAQSAGRYDPREDARSLVGRIRSVG